MINSVTVGFFMSPEILRVGFFMDFPKSVGFSMVGFFMVGFLCKSFYKTTLPICSQETAFWILVFLWVNCCPPPPRHPITLRLYFMYHPITLNWT